MPEKKEINAFTQQEFIHHAKDENLIQLCRFAETCFGRTLSWKDNQTIFDLYNNIKLNVEVIKYLLEYCTEKNISNITTIEKIGIEWAEKNISTLEEAKSYVYNNYYFRVLKSLGMGGVSLTPTHKEFIDKWLNVYKFSIEIILEGCKKTVAQINSPTLAYLDKILTEWHKQQIKKIEDIKKLDKKHEQSQKQKYQQKNVKKIPPKTQNHFQIRSHNWDFEAIKVLEKKYNDETDW